MDDASDAGVTTGHPHRRIRGRRRRPSGEPPPLPREHGLGRWLIAGAAVLLLGIVGSIVIHAEPLTASADELLERFVDLRGPVVTPVSKAFNALTLPGAVVGLRLAAVIVLVVVKRFRHLVVFLVTLAVTDWVVVRLLSAPRPAPVGVTLPVANTVWTFPSRPVSAIAITLFSAVMVLAPSGIPRVRWRVAAAVLIALVVFARLVLALDYPADGVYAAVLALMVSIVVFGLAAPDDAFPVTYARGGNAAHLDLGGARGRAVVRAMADQIGLDVTEVRPFGLEGSGGSSPLRMTLADGSHVFGKIFSTSHVRSDRWYRIGRTILYGRLEDETPFGSVRRIAEYEDYALRYLAAEGIHVANTWGIVELTPNREYMLVTEFFEGAKDLGDVPVDETVIDEGLHLVRRFWDVGVAHRDVKPANLLVRGGHLQLVDVSGLEIRPSPWRQAVDLANMMLTLALQSDPDLVYERALLVFAPDEIAEAFACAVGMAVPTQLTARLKQDPRPLMRRFKDLAPHEEAVSIQRWSVQRLALALAAVLGALVIAALFLDSLRAGVG